MEPGRAHLSGADASTSGDAMLSADSQAAAVALPRRGSRTRRLLRRHPTMVAGGALILLMVLAGSFAPVLGTTDPLNISPIERLRGPSGEHWFGTDMLGRDVYSRTLYGSRISLVVGLSVALLSTSIGLLIGVVSGYSRLIDGIVMRIMDGIMAIPSILLAIALMALSRASVTSVVLAITLPEIPRVVRLVRGLVLTIRENVYVEAAHALGAGFFRVVLRHILPNTLTPLIVQGTYICASAVIFEAYLSFLGAGTPPEIPSWGNIMAEGRVYIQLGFWILLFPGICLGLTVLGINLLGDGLRDTLDPRLAKRM
jgi:peptide/nickel transport system permease protein